MSSKSSPVIKPIGPITGPGVRLEKIHFVVSARDLPRRERGLLGSTVQDPYVKWSSKDKSVKDFSKPEVTKHRINEPNPEWQDHVFSYDWMVGTGQLWHFEIMDYDVANKDDNVGFVDVDVDRYLMEKNGEQAAKLSCGGSLLIKRCYPQQFRLSARNLPKLDAMSGLSDPYVKCYWSFGKDGPATLFATTKTIKNVENAVWDETIEFKNYQASSNQYWTFKVFDKDPLPKDDAIGEVAVEVDSYVTTKTVAVYNLTKDPASHAKLVITPV